MKSITTELGDQFSDIKIVHGAVSPDTRSAINNELSLANFFAQHTGNPNHPLVIDHHYRAAQLEAGSIITGVAHGQRAFVEVSSFKSDNGLEGVSVRPIAVNDALTQQKGKAVVDDRTAFTDISKGSGLRMHEIVEKIANAMAKSELRKTDNQGQNYPEKVAKRTKAINDNILQQISQSAYQQAYKHYQPTPVNLEEAQSILDDFRREERIIHDVVQSRMEHIPEHYDRSTGMYVSSTVYHEPQPVHFIDTSPQAQINDWNAQLAHAASLTPEQSIIHTEVAPTNLLGKILGW